MIQRNADKLGKKIALTISRKFRTSSQTLKTKF